VVAVVAVVCRSRQAKQLSANSRLKAFLSDACNKISSTMQTFLIALAEIRKVCMVDDILLHASRSKWRAVKLYRFTFLSVCR